MIKILIISTMAIDYNGVTDCLLQYLRAMDRSGMQIDILSAVSVNSKMEKNFLEIGCRVYKIDCRKKNPPLYVLKLAKFVKNGQYDIVHAHGNSATMAFDMLGAYLGGCKVRIAHSHSTECGSKWLDKMLRPFFYHLYTQGMACGKLAGEWLFQERKYNILPNGRKIDSYRYSVDARRGIRNKYNISDELVIGHVGRFNGPKNQKFVLEIFEELLKKRKDIRLILIGEGPLFEQIKMSAAEKNIAKYIIFTGSVDNVPEMLSAMDVMVLPSLHEGLPLVVMEWQAAGLPCIVSDNITRECAVTELVKFMPLSVGAKKWAEEISYITIEEQERKSDKWQILIKEAGFDITENSKDLKKLYEGLYRSCKKEE